jgi:hypothetical protein
VEAGADLSHFPSFPVASNVVNLDEGMPSSKQDAQIFAQTVVKLVSDLQEEAWYSADAAAFKAPEMFPSTCIIKSGASLSCLPVATDCGCGERSVSGPASLLTAFGGRPLDPVNLGEFVEFVVQEVKEGKDGGAAPLEGASLPFDLTGLANDTVSQSMLGRMESDMKTSAEKQRGAKSPQLKCLPDMQLNLLLKSMEREAARIATAMPGSVLSLRTQTSSMGNRDANLLCGSVKVLRQLRARLQSLQVSDSALLQVRERVNQLNIQYSIWVQLYQSRLWIMCTLVI